MSNPFLTKKDPVLEAVQTAMQDGAYRRQAEALVNEQFGVYSRKAVIREHLAAYDAALEETYQSLKEGVLDNIRSAVSNANPFNKVGDAIGGSKPAEAKPDMRIMTPAKPAAPKDGTSGSPFPANEEAMRVGDPAADEPLKKAGSPPLMSVADPKGLKTSFSAIRQSKGMPTDDLKEEEQIDEVKMSKIRKLADKGDTKRLLKIGDKDGKVESPKDEVWGSRLRAAKAAGNLEEGAHKALTGAGYKAGPRDSTTGFGRTYTHPKGHSAYVDADGFAHFGSGKKSTVTHGRKETEAHLSKLKEEQIDEISRRLATSYRDKATNDYRKRDKQQIDLLDKADETESGKKFQKYVDKADDLRTKNRQRMSGLDMANDKLKGRARVNVKEEQIDEISKEKLGKYVYKNADKRENDPMTGGPKESVKKLGKRREGLRTAVRKLTGNAMVNANEEKTVAESILNRLRQRRIEEDQSFNTALSEAGKSVVTGSVKPAPLGRVPLPPRGRPSSIGGVNAAPATPVAPRAAAPPVAGAGASTTPKAGPTTVTPNPATAASVSTSPNAAPVAAPAGASAPAGAQAAAPAAKAAPTPVKTVQTKGGAFPVFAKGSDASSEFKKAYDAAKPGSTFKWKASGETGPEREYKAAPVAKSSSAPTTPGSMNISKQPAPPESSTTGMSSAAERSGVSQTPTGFDKQFAAGKDVSKPAPEPKLQNPDENITKDRSKYVTGGTFEESRLNEGVQVGEHKYRIV